ncbi:TraM recognition domain-containing protein [Pseudactinotalea sp. Z1748]|uniref:type IV secretory system conjugative DNA transfer family protein n=1 Tax=Pseudactinotalea sp. Z1748 TaxID=3413027 RepID=UPI003C7BFF06
MNSSDRTVVAFLALLAAGLGLAGVLLGSGWLATLAACGASPEQVGLLDGFRLIIGGDETVLATAGGCTPTRAWGVGALTGIIVVLALIGIAAAVAWLRYRQSDTHFIRTMRYRNGFAHRTELRRHLGARAMVKAAGTLRPALLRRQVKATDVGWKVGTSRRIETYVSIEDSVIVIGPPRSGKGLRFIINAILDWPGPLVTTSTRNDNLAATYHTRQQMGEVIVFDPQRLSGIRSPVRISPITGCQDPMVATGRAAALVTGSGLGQGAQNQEWAGRATEQLSALLLAAAVGGRGVADLARWGGNPQAAAEAIDILNVDGPPGWGSSLESVIEGDQKLLGNIWFGVSGACAPLRIPQIAEAMTPRTGEATFNPDEFIQGTNTLYMIGTKVGAGAAGGYLAALLDDVVEQARRRALSMPGSRLDPPLGLVLDEIANIFTWPHLPTVMSDGGGSGISTLVVLQARSQAETAWSRAEMDSVFSAATAKMLLGGSADVAFLRDMENLLGQREEIKTERSYSEGSTSRQYRHERLAVMSIEEMRRMPAKLGLLAYRRVRPVLLDLEAWIDRGDARQVKAGKAATESAQREVFAEQRAQASARRRRW